MNPQHYQFLTQDHIRALHREAAAHRLAALARTTTTVRTKRRAIRHGFRLEGLRRLVARLATA